MDWRQIAAGAGLVALCACGRTSQQPQSSAPANVSAEPPPSATANPPETAAPPAPTGAPIGAPTGTTGPSYGIGRPRSFGAPVAPAPADFVSRFHTRMMRLDTDRDGRVSMKEWLAFRATHPGRNDADPTRQFQRMDANRDGYLTPDEIDATAQKLVARRAAMAGGSLPQSGQAPPEQ